MLDLSPFVPAGIGAAAALLVAAATHLFTSRRDKSQWTRHLKLQQEQWERERVERREQWDREDNARWEREKFGLYADLLTASSKWMNAAQEERPMAIIGRAWLTAAGDARLEQLGNEILRISDALEFVTPEEVMGKARGIEVLTTKFQLDYTDRNGEPPDTDVHVRCDRDLDRIVGQIQLVRRAMREDVGIVDK